METIVVYTDGSCRANGKENANGGIGVFFGDNDPRNKSINYTQIRKMFIEKHNEDLGIATNNKTELLAILFALGTVEEHLNDKKTLIIKSDSNYSIKCVTDWSVKWKKNDWKTANGVPVSNQFIIKTIVDFIEKYPLQIKFRHVRSHRREPPKDSELYKDWYYNDRADYLATSC